MMESKWFFCCVCRRNHGEGRKHIFTRTHKAKLSDILFKFTKKVRSARRFLCHPSVLEGELEPGSAGKMWCYCCELEIEKHVTNGQVSIEWAGLLEHMTGSEHHKKTRRYWWLHGVETRKLPMFLLFPAEYKHYTDLVRGALSDLADKKEGKRQELACELKTEEERRALEALEPPSGQQTKSKPAHQGNKRVSKSVSWSASTRGVRFTASVSDNGPNLTAIRPVVVPGMTDNVHTGATPPWLRDDGCNVNHVSPMIGPSLDNFILHRERKKRAGRNPNRVGADFHIKLATHKQPDLDSWLPSFGRVWNSGSRFQSKKEFLKQLDTMPPTTVSSVPASSPCQTSTTVRNPSFQLLPHRPYLGEILSSVFSHDQGASQADTSPLSSLHDSLSSSPDPLGIVLRTGKVACKEEKISSNCASLEHVSCPSDIAGLMIQPYVRKRKKKLSEANQIL